MIKSEPKTLMKSKNKSNNNQPLRSRNKTGGGDNPTRTTLNRNASGDYKTPRTAGRDRLNRSGDSTLGGQVPDLAGHPARGGRNASGDYKTPKINRVKTRKTSY